MKKIFGISMLIMLLLVVVVGITYSYEYNDDESLIFQLIGSYEITLDLGNTYVESGIIVNRNGEDISSLVKIDNSMVDTSKVGDYKVKYELDMDGNREYIYRIVKVRENIKPEIILKGDLVVYVDLNGVYYEPGFDVIDNYDDYLYNKVNVINYVNTSKVGEYQIVYSVTDSSGNSTSINRTVIVK